MYNIIYMMMQNVVLMSSNFHTMPVTVGILVVYPHVFGYLTIKRLATLTIAEMMPLPDTALFLHSFHDIEVLCLVIPDFRAGRTLSYQQSIFH